MQKLKKSILFFLISIISVLTVAKAQDVVKAENDFADYVKSHSVKQGFLKFMDSAAVTFVRGGDTVNAVKFWQKLPEGSDIMVWKPAFHATSKAADLGFTTGPYESKPSVNGQVLGFGQYTTIWKKDKKGEWKFLLDMGTSTTDNLFDKSTLSEFKGNTSNKKDTSNILNIEKNFIKQYVEIGVNAYRNYLIKNSWFNISKTNPLADNGLIIETLNKQQPKVEFEPISSYMSVSKDLAFVYGKTIAQNRKSNYLRIWARTKEGWKILVQVQK